MQSCSLFISVSMVGRLSPKLHNHPMLGGWIVSCPGSKNFFLELPRKTPVVVQLMSNKFQFIEIIYMILRTVISKTEKVVLDVAVLNALRDESAARCIQFYFNITKIVAVL